jgi:RNA polymerase sporulation-specific sigma factor
LNEYLNGCSYSEIATRLDSHVKAVDNAVQRIKKKVDKHIERDEI